MDNPTIYTMLAVLVPFELVLVVVLVSMLRRYLGRG